METLVFNFKNYCLEKVALVEDDSLAEGVQQVDASVPENLYDVFSDSLLFDVEIIHVILKFQLLHHIYNGQVQDLSYFQRSKVDV